MFFAIDSNGNRISVHDTEEKQEYFCPVCKSKLTIRDGSINAKHFAHIANTCLDDWNYDMSEWHHHKQSFFSPEFCEVIVSNSKETHRADVLIDKTVIEFQHSPISADEFEKRTQFFINSGYRIAWVFDVTQQFESEAISCLDENNDNKFLWKHPIKIFSKCPNISDTNKDFALWLNWDINDEDQDMLSKVIWAPKDENNQYTLNRFIISPYYIEMSVDIHPDSYFKSQEDYFKEAVKELKQKHNFSIKYCGVKGRKKENYTCNKQNKFGIDLWSENGCAYCRYCYMIAEKKRPAENKWAVYCCYPDEVRELTDTHPGYECIKADIYSL